MKPYFHKAEHFTPNPDYEMDIKVRHQRDCVDIQERGSGGFWKTSYPPTSDLSKDVMKSIVCRWEMKPDLTSDRFGNTFQS